MISNATSAPHYSKLMTFVVCELFGDEIRVKVVVMKSHCYNKVYDKYIAEKWDYSDH